MIHQPGYFEASSFPCDPEHRTRMAKTLGYSLESTSAKSDLPPSDPFVPGRPGEACPACGGCEACVLFAATDRLGATTMRFQIVECKQCRLIRLEPQPTPQELRGY